MKIRIRHWLKSFIINTNYNQYFLIELKIIEKVFFVFSLGQDKLSYIEHSRYRPAGARHREQKLSHPLFKSYFSVLGRQFRGRHHLPLYKTQKQSNSFFSGKLQLSFTKVIFLIKGSNLNHHWNNHSPKFLFKITYT